MTCSEFQRLTDYADGLLSSAEANATSRHLAAGCLRCAADFDWYARVKAIAAGDESVEPPAWVFDRALRAFSLKRRAIGVAERFGNLVASLSFDSFGQAAPAMARATETAGRQLLYRAPPYSIDINIARSDSNKTSLTGQVLRGGEARFGSVAGLSLAVIRDGLTILRTATNDTGEFTIEGLEKGQYELRIDAVESSITIVGLPVA